MSDRPEVGLDRRASNPEERIQRLAQEKSFLQLVIDLTNRMIAVPGLEALADCILQGLAGVIGGTDLSLWYRVDGRYRCHALSGAPRTLDAPDDELVASVFAQGRPLDFESRFDETRMTTAAFGAARTWVQPLAVGDEVVGVVRLDNLHSGLADASSAMRTLFAYMAMALNNAVTSRDRLREANARLADEVARRRRAEDDLRASHDLLEQRVVERTHDLVQANDALGASHEAFQCILATTTAGFWQLDCEGRIVAVNAGYERLSGYTAAEVIGRHVSDFDVAQPADEVDQHMATLRESAFDYFETRHRRKDGSLWDVEVSCSRLERDGGVIFGFLRDITDRKRAEEERAAQLDFVQRIFDSTDAHMAVVGPDGTIQAVNSAWSRFARENGSTGPGSDWVGAQYFRSCEAARGNATGAIEAYAGIRRVQAGEAQSFTFEYPCHAPGGRERWFVMHVLPLRGSRGAVLVSHQDVTARRQAESDLRQNERIMRVSQRLARVGGWELDLERGGLRWTDETSRIHGLPVDPEGIDRSESDREAMIAMSLGCYDEADRPVISEALRRCGEEGVPYDLEFPFTPKGGRRGWIRTTAMPVRRDGRIVAVVGCIMDITDSRIHEIERVKMEKLESLGVLAGGIAHDFNNILTAIIGNLSLARDIVERSHPAAETLAEAEKAAMRATALAHQLLTFARGGKPVRKSIAPGPLVREAVSLVLRGTNVVGEVDIPDRLDAVHGDETQLVQVWNNIALNAVQAMVGGGRLAVAARNVPASEAPALGLPAQDFVELSFADEGPGIADADLERIFDPYFTTKPGGNGLGLASVHSIIARHGGLVRAESGPGRGATFHVFLPSLGPATVAGDAAEAGAASPVPAAGGRILVMDDEASIRTLGEAMLRRLGWQAETCADGAEAVRLYRGNLEAGHPYDAVIMDLTVPGGMGGKEAAAAILRFAPDAWLIVSSGYSNDPVMADVASCGFRGAVAKPYDLPRLREALEHVPRLAAP
jgi:PAS domain S-box-containing protein